MKSIADVVAMQLCTGCGACAYVEADRFRMADTLEYGRRPFLRDGAPAEKGEALAACPGVKLDSSIFSRNNDAFIHSLFDGWGPVLGVWEGYAVDEDIRFSGSSGGAATALALYCLDKMNMSGVLHTAARLSQPYMNETVMSTSRAELLARTGSRYSPSSPLDKLGLIEKAANPCVFIGKPCDAAALQRVREMRPNVDEKLGLVLAFFCAGVPSTKGNLDLLKVNGIDDLSAVTELRYRGKGWPGMWTVRYINELGEEEIRQMTYADSWGFLQEYRQWRCYICPDHTGEFADIAVGDPWYRPVQPNESGKSLIVARTQHGLDVLKAAADAGYIVLESNDPSLLPRSQPGLLSTRGAIWARLKMLRLFGAAAPDYIGFNLFKLWIFSLNIKDKLRSMTGTAKRVFTKKLTQRAPVREWDSSSRP